MSVQRDARTGQWRYRKRVTLPDGRRIRISGTPNINTKKAAEDAERAHIERTLRGDSPVEPIRRKEAPMFERFAEQFLELSALKNKPSEVSAKESRLRVHLTPYFEGQRLNEIDYARVQDYVAAKIAAGLSKKTVNNHLTILRRMLVVAKKRGLISSVPEIEWLRVAKPAFDFLDFEEADRLVGAGDGEWATMILVALRTGLRQGELLALRWEDVDLVSGQLHVRQSAVDGIVSTPKSNRSRTVPLSEGARQALKQHRHLRGELVFSSSAGRMLTKGECKWPLRRACNRAGLRRVGWHVLRHSFASHLTMRGVSLKVVQELLGHATLEMTMRYAHLSPAVIRDAVHVLDQPVRTGQPLANARRTGT